MWSVNGLEEPLKKKNMVSKAPGIDEMLCQVVDNLS
jgi:hypothetical protein